MCNGIHINICTHVTSSETVNPVFYFTNNVETKKKYDWSSGMIPASGAGGRGVRFPHHPHLNKVVGVIISFICIYIMLDFGHSFAQSCWGNNTNPVFFI